jgi:hypothetical protein
MEGTWELKVTVRDCHTGAPVGKVRALNTFASGGILMESVTGDRGGLRGPGQGFWRHIWGPNYTAVTQAFRFKKDGGFAGTEKVTRCIELGEGGDEFTATASIQVFDADDSLIQTACATETARRLQALCK